MNTSDVAATEADFKTCLRSLSTMAAAAAARPSEQEALADALVQVAAAARAAGFPRVAASGYRAAAQADRMLAAWHDKQAARYERQAFPAVMRPHREARGRAPRRAARPTKPATKAGSSQDGPPPPLLVSDASAFAIVGLQPRKFRAFVRERGIESVKVGRRTLVRADILLRELGLDVAPSDVKPPELQWSADRVVLRLMKGGAK